jgi:hypothetical protein
MELDVNQSIKRLAIEHELEVEIIQQSPSEVEKNKDECRRLEVQHIQRSQEVILE